MLSPAARLDAFPFIIRLFRHYCSSLLRGLSPRLDSELLTGRTMFCPTLHLPYLAQLRHFNRVNACPVIEQVSEGMNEFMDGWICWWMDKWVVDGGRWLYELIYLYVGELDGWADGWIHRWIVLQIYESWWVDKWLVNVQTVDEQRKYRWMDWWMS